MAHHQSSLEPNGFNRNGEENGVNSSLPFGNPNGPMPASLSNMMGN
jgi:hypothetical protein